jgi:D-serine deaminase-like pyridoxal phosphate-dependent protein
VDTGGGRTGIPAQDADTALTILAELRARDVAFGGLHSYDGHLADLPEADQQRAVTAELHDLVALAERIEATGTEVTEIVAGGSHTFIPGARTVLPGPWNTRVGFGAGTVVYNDLRSLDRFGPKGFRHAAFALSRVVSDQGAGRITLDAGLTTIQVDGGRPHARLLGRPAQVGAPAQEHLQVRIESGPVPAIGAPLLLVPRHVDTMLAQFDRVYLADAGSVRESATVQRPF